MPTRHPIEREFKTAIREFREAAGLSQEGLALSIAMQPTYLSQLERGLKVPTLGTIIRLADGLGQTPHALVQRAEELAGRRRRGARVPPGASKSPRR